MKSKLHHCNALWLRCIAGISLFMLSMGINRYALTPAIPFLVNKHWLTSAQAGYVGSWNFFGYFLSACFCYRLTPYFKTKTLFYTAIILTIIASSSCALNFGYLWHACWHFITGLLSGLIMILAPTLILEGIPHNRKALVSGVMFIGVGLGVIATSLLTSVFNQFGGIAGIELGLTGFSILLAVLIIPTLSQASQIKSQRHHQSQLHPAQRRTFTAALIGYVLYTFGVTPSQLFLSNYAHEIGHLSLSVSGNIFALLGLGCIAGSMLCSWLHNMLNNRSALLITSIIGIIGLACIVCSSSLLAIELSAFLTGFYLMGNISLISLLVTELTDLSQHARYWSFLTLSASAAQFLGGLLFSYLLSQHISYALLFQIGLASLVVSLFCYCSLPRQISISPPI